MEAPDHTETRIASITRDENGVITIVLKNCGMVDEFDVLDLHLAVRHMASHKPALKLVVATADWDMSKAAKEKSRQEDLISKTRARAIVVSNNIKASLLNFLHQFDNQTYPQQFFASTDEAYNWLLSFREDPFKELLL